MRVGVSTWVSVAESLLLRTLKKREKVGNEFNVKAARVAAG